MSIFSRIRELFTGGSSRKTESRRRPTTSYRSRGSRLSSSSFNSSSFGNPSGMSLEERLEKKRKEDEEKRKKTTATLASISKNVEQSTKTGTQRAIEKMEQKSVASTANKTTLPKAKTKPRTEEEVRQNARENAQKKLKSISKKTGKALRVKSPEEMTKSGDYEYRPKAKNLNTPSASDRSTVRPTLQGYKKQMSNPAFRVAQSATRGYGGGATFGLLEPLLRGNKDDATERAIEKYYQEHKSKGAELVGDIAGTFTSFGLTGGGASNALKRVAPKSTEALGTRGAEFLAKNPRMLKTAEKEAIRRFGTEGATKEVIEQIAKRRGREIMAELGKDASINVTTGLLNDVVRASTEHELFSDDWWKEMRDNALINVPLGVATSAVPAFRVGKNFDDALDAVAPRAGAMADEALERVRPEVAETAQNVADDVADYGYHAGDLGKAEWFRNQAVGGRDTGHFGTGTYFVGDEKIITDNSYGQRPHHKINFKKYNLFKPKNSDVGFNVHRRLRQLNDYSLDPDGLIKEFTINANEVEEASEIVTGLLRSGDIDGANEVANRVLTKGELNYVQYDAERRLQTWLENGVENATPERAYQVSLDDAVYNKAERLINNGNEEFGHFVDELARDLDRSPEEIQDALDATIDTLRAYPKGADDLINQQNYDSASTIFMKNLGYEGVDVRGLNGLDNTGYGSVIYDLHPEDLTDTARAKNATIHVDRAEREAQEPLDELFGRYRETAKNAPEPDYDMSDFELTDDDLADVDLSDVEEVIAKMKARNTNAEAPKPKTEAPKKTKAPTEESIEKMVAKRNALKKEREDLIQSIEDEYGNINPNYKNLTPEQRASVTERKKRMQKINKDVDNLSKSITEMRKANPSTSGRYTSKYAGDAVPTEELREARKDLKEEFSELRKEVQSAEKSLANGGKDVDVDLLEGNRKRLAKLKDDIDAIDRRLGTKPVVDGRTKEAKVNAETKPKPTAKTEVKPETEPRVDVEPKAESAVEAKPKEELKYEDIDLSAGHTKEERAVIRAKMKELQAEAQRLDAVAKTDAEKARVEELRAEANNINRALKRKTGTPAKRVDPEKVKAQKLAEESKKSAEANANGKPLPKNKETKPKAEKPKKELTPEQQAKEEARKRAKAEKRLEREFDEVHREHTRLTNNNEDVGTRQSAKTAFAVATEREKKKIVKDGKTVLKDFAESGMTSSDNKSIFSYQRLNRARQDELVEAGYKRVTEDPKAVFKKLKSKVDAMDTMSLEDIADTVGIRQYYADIGREIPEDVEDVLTKVVAQGQTDHAQLLKVTDLILRRYSPDYRKKLMRRDLEKFREVVCNSSSEKDWEKTLASLDKKFGVDGYLDKKLDELKAVTDPKEFKKEYTALCRDIFRNTEPTMWDVANLIRHSFMLGSNKTALNNIFGNLSMRGMYSVSDKLTVLGERGLESHQNKKIAQLAKEQNSLRDKLATLTEGSDEFKKVEAQIEELTSKIQANRVTRTTEFLKNKDLKKLSRQLKEGTVMSKVDEAVGKNRNYDDVEFAELFDNNTHDAVEEAMGDTKYGFHSDKGIDLKVKDATTTGGKLKRVVAKGASLNSKRVGFKLNEPDRWFVERSYRDSFARYLQANGITSAEAWKAHPDVIEKASAHAMDVALENTYKKNTRLVKVLESQRAKGYRKGSNIARKAVTMGMDAELPYLKVPANMVVNALKYSPIGALKSAGDMAVAIHKGDVDALTKAVNELSKGLTGTGLFAIGYYTSVKDQEDEDSIGFIAHARDELKEYNIRDNSFMVGGHNYNIANLGMGVTQALMGARYAELQNEKGGAPTSILDDVDSVMQAFETVFDVEADTSLMENALGIFDVISNQGDYEMTASERAKNLGAKIVSDYIGQYTNPSSLRAIGRGTTSADLDTGVKKGEETTKTQRMIERNKNNLVSSVPILNEKVLPHKVDRHGNLINERKTSADKAKAVLQNYNDPFSRRKVHIPDADKVELSIKDDKGKPYQPQHFDEDREYKAQIGEKKYAKVIDLTPKEREMAGRAFKTSGYDMAYNLVTAHSGWFGDSHGARAQQILRDIPDDEEKAREYLYNTPEFKNASDYEKRRMMDTLYDKRLGRGRSANYEIYVNQRGNDEGEFKFQNDLNSNKQGKYYDNNLEQYGISKGKWAEIIENAEYESHKYKNGLNTDTINSAYKFKKALLETEGLSDEARLAAYEVIRGNRKNMFGWYDWDGKTLKGYGRYRRRGYRRWRRRGYGSSKKAKVPAPKTIKASSFTKGEALVSKKKSSGNTTNVNPKLERVKAKIDLPTPKR